MGDSKRERNLRAGSKPCRWQRELVHRWRPPTDGSNGQVKMAEMARWACPDVYNRAIGLHRDGRMAAEDWGGGGREVELGGRLGPAGAAQGWRGGGALCQNCVGSRREALKMQRLTTSIDVNLLRGEQRPKERAVFAATFRRTAATPQISLSLASFSVSCTAIHLPKIVSRFPAEAASRKPLPAPHNSG